MTDSSTASRAGLKPVTSGVSSSARTGLHPRSVCQARLPGGPCITNLSSAVLLAAFPEAPRLKLAAPGDPALEDASEAPPTRLRLSRGSSHAMHRGTVAALMSVHRRQPHPSPRSVASSACRAEADEAAGNVLVLAEAVGEVVAWGSLSLWAIVPPGVLAIAWIPFTSMARRPPDGGAREVKAWAFSVSCEMR